MERKRLNQLALGAAVAVLAVVGYRGMVTTSGPPSPSSNGTATMRTQQKAGPAVVEAPDVHLGKLEDDRPKPGDDDRNLFRFRPKAPPPPPPSTRPPSRPVTGGGLSSPAPVPSGPP